MRSCGQQAAAIHRTTFSVPSPIATASHHSSPQAVVHIRAPRSPPTSPRHSLDPADPELVRQLRQFLLRAASRPAGISDELEQMLQCKLAVSTNQLEDLFSSSSLAEASTSSQMQPQQLQELESGLDHMLQLFSKAEVFRLLQQQPALLFVPLASWCEFFTGYGFSSSQIRNLISQTRGEVMTKSDLVTAGDAIMHLKALGFDNEDVRYRVVAYCPQVLSMSRRDIDVLIKLWDKFKYGVNQQGPC